MFNNQRYLTKGVQAEIPITLQLFMWNCIKTVPEPDYLQIFRLEAFGTMQKIIHEQEVPEFKREYLIPTDKPLTSKVYIIDSDEYSTMLLAEEY